jgi:hypothetical protein
MGKDSARFDSESANLYVYAAGDPVNYYDPRGEVAQAIVIVLAAASAAVILAFAYNRILDANRDRIDTDVCPGPPPPREICRLINETDTLCVYKCPLSGIRFKDRPSSASGWFPANDVCRPTIVGP